MEVGMLTAPFEGESLEYVLDFAEAAAIPCLEVPAHPGASQIDSAAIGARQARQTRDALDKRCLRITSLGYYTADLTLPGKRGSAQAAARKVINAAALLGVDTVCMLAGWPVKGKTKIETIREVLPGLWKPILAHARKKGVRIAIENYFDTCLQGIDTFEELFKAIPDAHFGLNYDPSHLVHQECDHLAPVTLFRDRIFHTHAKDTLIDRARRAHTGILAPGWWRYVLPGFGQIHWGEYISHLRQNGYDGVLSIEHEDSGHTPEEGFIRAAQHLAPFC